MMHAKCFNVKYGTPHRHLQKKSILTSMLVTFEGPEGAGKTTVISLVKEMLIAEGLLVYITREPGSGAIGGLIRETLLHGEYMDAKTELFLFLADRAQHVVEVLQPALKSGKIVLCDRYIDSTIVYQGYGRGFNLNLLRQFNEVATDGLKPDLTILLDIDPKAGLQRQQKKDRLDQESLEFHQKVREGFLSESKQEPKRWKVIDASLPIEEVSHKTYQAILDQEKSLKKQKATYKFLAL